MRPNGHTRGLAEMLEIYHAGSGLLRHQLRRAQRGRRRRPGRSATDRTATTAVQAGTLPACTDLVAHVAIFYVLRDGKILRQSSYDCYESVPALT